MGNAKRLSYVVIGSAMAVCAGLITFAAGDWSLSQPQFHPFGLTLVTLSVFADAVLPNAQEKLFRTFDASKSEVMFFTNIYTLLVQTISAFLSGDLMGMFHFVIGKQVKEVNYFSGLMAVTNSTADLNRNEDEMMDNSTSGEIRHKFILHICCYILISYIAVSAHTAVVKKFGGVAAVFVGTARKGMTLILSFLLFPKESNWKYGAGAFLVLGGLAVASLEKQRKKRKTSVPFSQELQGGNPSIDSNILIPDIPYSDANHSANNLSNVGGDGQERESLLNLDAELGRAPSAVGNGPERRR